MAPSGQFQLAAVMACALAGCRDAQTSATPHAESSSLATGTAAEAPASSPAVSPSSGDAASEGSSGAPLLGARAFAATVYAKPSLNSRKLGYLRVGARVERSAEPAGTSGCKEGWYAIQPEGYVCTHDDGTIDMTDPLVRAASVRPRLDRPLPYRYGFVRSVVPYYLRVPVAERQFKSEFQLQEHLDWYKDNHAEVQSAALGAWDVPIDESARAIPGKALGEIGRGKNSGEMGLGELFGGESDADPWPFWLRDDERLIPNVSGFDVPEFAVFADRARRHTGIAFVGSFDTDEHYLRRRFAITTDLRLTPTTKVKPDSASPWHGVEIGRDIELPFAFASRRGVQAYNVANNAAEPAGELQRRTAHKLAGKVQKVAGERYLKLEDGRWVKDEDVGMVVRPGKWPEPASKGEKWIEIDLSEQVLVLWEGKTAVFATLVSTGRPAIGDPETTTSTPRGQFHIYAKHISATMDSDEGASERNPGVKVGDDGYVPKKGDGAYGKTVRRGQGLFKLRDVPHIQYFNKNYAIHGAYWHDVFGIARSHGCVNLAPADSLRVFLWTEPQVPQNWHGVTTDRGTAVIIHQ